MDDVCYIDGKFDIKCIKHKLKTVNCHELFKNSANDQLKCSNRIEEILKDVNDHMRFIDFFNRMTASCNYATEKNNDVLDGEILLCNNPCIIDPVNGIPSNILYYAINIHSKLLEMM